MVKQMIIVKQFGLICRNNVTDIVRGDAGGTAVCRLLPLQVASIQERRRRHQSSAVPGSRLLQVSLVAIDLQENCVDINVVRVAERDKMS